MIALVATRRPALVAAIITLVVVALVGCGGKGVDVAVVGIPDGATVSVDALPWDTAAAPSRVYRYAGVGYARLLGLAAAPSYTATARRLDGAAVAVGSVEYDGSDEVRIDLHPVDNCDKTSTPTPDPQPVAPSPQPQPQPQPMPQPQPQPMPPADADKDGVPDAQDLCPLLAGTQPPTSRPGCPMPRTVDAQLVPMAKGGIQTASGFDFAVSLPTQPQYLDFLIILPVEAATARQVSVDYNIAATAKWAAPSGWCASQGLANRHQLGPGTPGSTTYCLAYGYRAGLSSLTMQPGEFIVESPRPAGDAPTQIKATMPQGQVGVVDARAQNVVRLMLAGSVSVNDVVATATVTMEF